MKKKNTFAAIGVLSVAAIATGGTIAFLHDSVPFENSFQLGAGETEYVEAFESPNNWKSCDTTPKELVITNKSDIPVRARFKIEDYWKKAGSTSTDHTNEISPVYQGQNVAIINFQNQDDWEQKGEWYVYKNVLQKNQSTSSLLASVTFNCDINFAGEMVYSSDGKSSTTSTNDYQNAKYHLFVTAQTLQSDQTDSSWSIATFLSGSYGSKRITGIYDATSLVKSTAAPAESIQAVNVADANSDKPIYMWVDNNTLYWYSEANEVYLPENATDMFASLYLKTVPGLANVNTSRTTNMHHIFYYNHGMTDSASFANWDVSNVTDFNYAFYFHEFSSLDGFSNWDMSKATDIASMFGKHATQPTNISDTTAIANWNVSNVTTMEYFMGNLKNIDASSLENWNITRARVHDADTAFDLTAIKPTWAQ